MKFLIDECLSREFAGRLAQQGFPDSVHPIHIGLCGVRDDVIVQRALDEDRIIVTANAVDFRQLAAGQEIHPGLIILENAERETGWRLLSLALSFLELQPNPRDYMINRVLELSLAQGIVAYELPRDDDPPRQA